MYQLFDDEDNEQEYLLRQEDCLLTTVGLQQVLQWSIQLVSFLGGGVDGMGVEKIYRGKNHTPLLITAFEE